MSNSKKSVKSKGVVVFAFNSGDVKYVDIADQTSRLIDKNLKLPITLITDHDVEPAFAYDNVIRIDPQGDTFKTYDTTLRWRNFGRYLAYQLSPYDETILLDTDYLVLDDSLLTLWKTNFDYKLMHHSVNYDRVLHSDMGNTSLPFVWATVVLFRKSEQSQMLFDLVGKIQRNYQYYRALFNVREGNFRNDYAFAMANIILNGYALNQQQGIPWSMFTIEDEIKSMELKQNTLHVKHDQRAVVVPMQNIHVMDKQYLQSDDFKQLVEVLCE